MAVFSLWLCSIRTRVQKFRIRDSTLFYPCHQFSAFKNKSYIMQKTPDSRTNKDTVPNVIVYPDLRVRKLSMAESIVEVYDLDPKVGEGLQLWELTRLPEVFDPHDDSWPFILAAQKHPIFRLFPRPSDTEGNVRYFVTWMAFDIIQSHMGKRNSAGYLFSPWDNQYKDLKPQDEPTCEDELSQAAEEGETAQTRVSTPTEDEVIQNSFMGAIVDGVPLLALGQGNAKPTDSQQEKGCHQKDSQDPPTDQAGASDDINHSEGVPGASVEASQSIAPTTDDVKSTDGTQKKSLLINTATLCSFCRSTDLLCLAGHRGIYCA
ncbi:MAG: hypothetical protein Q9169_002151 [Polycauliona sp. 2 TL-2023]